MFSLAEQDWEEIFDHMQETDRDSLNKRTHDRDEFYLIFLDKATEEVYNEITGMEANILGLPGKI